MTKIQNFYNTTGSKVNKTYWRAEALLHEFSLWFMPPFMVIFVFLFVAQFDYIQHRKDKDYSVLPIAKQERLKTLKNEELALYKKEGEYRNNFDFNSARNISKKRMELFTEIKAIINEAPYSSWSYKFYVAIGAINPHKDL